MTAVQSGIFIEMVYFICDYKITTEFVRRSFKARVVCDGPKHIGANNILPIIKLYNKEENDLIITESCI